MILYQGFEKMMNFGLHWHYSSYLPNLAVPGAFLTWIAGILARGSRSAVNSTPLQIHLEPCRSLQTLAVYLRLFCLFFILSQPLVALQRLHWTRCSGSPCWALHSFVTSKTRGLAMSAHSFVNKALRQISEGLLSSDIHDGTSITGSRWCHLGLSLGGYPDRPTIVTTFWIGNQPLAPAIVYALPWILFRRYRQVHQ